VAGIPREIHDRASGLDDEAAPQAAVAVMQASRGEMLGGYIGYTRAGEFHALPPIELDRGTNVGLREVPRVAQSGRHAWRPVFSDLTQGRQIHVIVMVVGDQDEVHAR